jgi:glutamate 5-kinase
MTQTIAIKVGSSTLTNGTRQLYKPNILEIVRQIVRLHEEGNRVLLITSGARAAGRDHLGHPKLPTSIPAKQMLSAVGQVQLMSLYSELFDLYDVRIGQVLVTADDLRRNRARYLNSRDTLESLLAHRIVPVINENDTVAVEEIKLGDNDNLAAQIASLVNADILLLLTDLDGLYDKNPKLYPDAKRIEVVANITDEIRAIAGGDSSSGLGTGGMATKIQAAEFAGRSGIMTVIAYGKAPDVILRVAAGESLGTRFLPSARRVESRKRWLLTEGIQGALTIDEGAANALRKGSASLLPVGIRAVSGDFQRGALVLVQDVRGLPLARGQVTYDSQELARLCGIKSKEIETVLGYTYGDVAIHKDYMALLQFEEGERL